MPKTEETETERIKNIFDFDSFERAKANTNVANYLMSSNI